MKFSGPYSFLFFFPWQYPTLHDPQVLRMSPFLYGCSDFYNNNSHNQCSSFRPDTPIIDVCGSQHFCCTQVFGPTLPTCLVGAWTLPQTHPMQRTQHMAWSIWPFDACFYQNRANGHWQTCSTVRFFNLFQQKKTWLRLKSVRTGFVSAVIVVYMLT